MCMCETTRAPASRPATRPSTFDARSARACAARRRRAAARRGAAATATLECAAERDDRDREAVAHARARRTRPPDGETKRHVVRRASRAARASASATSWPPATSPPITRCDDLHGRFGRGRRRRARSRSSSSVRSITTSSSGRRRPSAPCRSGRAAAAQEGGALAQAEHVEPLQRAVPPRLERGAGRTARRSSKRAAQQRLEVGAARTRRSWNGLSGLSGRPRDVRRRDDERRRSSRSTRASLGEDASGSGRCSITSNAQTASNDASARSSAARSMTRELDVRRPVARARVRDRLRAQVDAERRCCATLAEEVPSRSRRRSPRRARRRPGTSAPRSRSASGGARRCPARSRPGRCVLGELKAHYPCTRRAAGLPAEPPGPRRACAPRTHRLAFAAGSSSVDSVTRIGARRALAGAARALRRRARSGRALASFRRLPRRSRSSSRGPPRRPRAPLDALVGRAAADLERAGLARRCCSRPRRCSASGRERAGRAARRRCSACSAGWPPSRVGGLARARRRARQRRRGGEHRDAGALPRPRREPEHGRAAPRGRRPARAVALVARAGAARRACSRRCVLVLLAASIVASGSRGALLAGCARRRSCPRSSRRAAASGRAARRRGRRRGGGRLRWSPSSCRAPSRSGRPVRRRRTPRGPPPPPRYLDAEGAYPLDDDIGRPLPGGGQPTVRRSFLGSSGRIEAWKGALRQAEQRPLLGYGFGTESRVFVDRYYTFARRCRRTRTSGSRSSSVRSASLALLGLVAVLARCLRGARSRPAPRAASRRARAPSLAGSCSPASSRTSTPSATSRRATFWICAFLVPARRAERRERERPAAALLVLNQYYWPGVEATAHLLSELCAALADEFDITVVTGAPARARARAGASRPRRRRHRPRALDRLRPAPPPRRARQLPDLSRRVAARRARRAERPDVVLCMTDPPVIADVALVVARRFRVPLVVDQPGRLPRGRGRAEAAGEPAR